MTSQNGVYSRHFGTIFYRGTPTSSKCHRYASNKAITSWYTLTFIWINIAHLCVLYVSDFDSVSTIFLLRVKDVHGDTKESWWFILGNKVIWSSSFNSFVNYNVCEIPYVWPDLRKKKFRFHIYGEVLNAFVSCTITYRDRNHTGVIQQQKQWHWSDVMYSFHPSLSSYNLYWSHVFSIVSVH